MLSESLYPKRFLHFSAHTYVNRFRISYDTFMLLAPRQLKAANTRLAIFCFEWCRGLIQCIMDDHFSGAIARFNMEFRISLCLYQVAVKYVLIFVLYYY